MDLARLRHLAGLQPLTEGKDFKSLKPGFSANYKGGTNDDWIELEIDSGKNGKHNVRVMSKKGGMGKFEVWSSDQVEKFVKDKGLKYSHSSDHNN